MIKFLAEAIWNLTGGAEYGTSPKEDGSYTIEWLDEKTQPTQAEIDAEIIRLQAEYDAKQYQRDRQPEYPNIGDQLDYMFHNGFDKWKEDIVQPIKDKYPKPE
tara:strand:- start:911 stop:1219 length:309 start_codon:yes stop_codon:yes gene_type:complete